MAKKPKSYSLDEKLIAIIEKKAVKAGRSESYIANEVLSSVLIKGKK